MANHLQHIEPTLRPLAVPIEQIHNDQDNVRKHPEQNLDAIKKSLEAFGQQKPIVIDKHNTCLAGNGTLLAARALGWTHLAAVTTGLSGSSARAYAIADNRTTDTSQWDMDKLSQQMANLQNQLDFDHLTTGFDDSQIEEAINKALHIENESLRDVAIPDTYQLLVACEDEQQQKQLFERLEQEGFPCRVLTL
ncbi:MAG: ParB/RepB/Spo0J family partition protein [Phycisphaeraceae bacterium JB051]